MRMRWSPFSGIFGGFCFFEISGRGEPAGFVRPNRKSQKSFSSRKRFSMKSCGKRKFLEWTNGISMSSDAVQKFTLKMDKSKCFLRRTSLRKMRCLFSPPPPPPPTKKKKKKKKKSK